MHFEPSKCKVILQDVLGLNTPLTLQGEILALHILEDVLALIAAYQVKLMHESRKPESHLPISATYVPERHKSEPEGSCVHDYSAGGFVVWQ